MTAAEADWKQFLKGYAEQLNRAMVTGHASDLTRVYLDMQDQQNEEARWQRYWEQLRARNAHPLAAKLLVEPLSAVERGTEQVDVVLKLHQQLCYLHGNKAYQEENSRIQKVTLQRVNEVWGFLKPWEWFLASKEEYQKTAAAGHAGSEKQKAIPVIQTQSAGYDRFRAVAYADMYWSHPNPAYPYLHVDCTNFISQCLHAGGIPMVFTGNKGTGWWFRGWSENWSYSWAVANSLHMLLSSGKAPMYAVRRQSPEELEPGDVICYDFNGNGHWQHNTIVTAFDDNGMPLVNAHTTDSSHRYWEYKDSTAYTENIKYDFFHIRGKG